MNTPLPEMDMVRVLTGSFRELHGAITKRRIADGTAALVMLVEHDHRRLIIANSGDERAVLSRGGKAVQLTTDHKPEEPSEKVRVYDCGGFVNEQKRVDGILSLSRALGDNDLQPHVTYEPEVYTVELADDDSFVILACDGLWDVITNEHAVRVASRYANPAEAAAALRDYAHMLGSTDNISVIVYRLDLPDSERGSSSGVALTSKEEAHGSHKDSKRHTKRLSDVQQTLGEGSGTTPNKTASKRQTKLYPPGTPSSSSGTTTVADSESPKKSTSSAHGRKGSSAQPKASPREKGRDDND
jgi:serine/threonine protein phosphatase PrpC